MRRFTYARKASQLRGQLLPILVLLLGDVAVLALLTWLVPGLWKLVVVGAGLGLMGGAYLAVTAVLRTTHSLDDRALHLAYGRFRLTVPLRAVASAGNGMAEDHQKQDPRTGQLPPPSCEPVYRPQEDALYLLSDRHRLVTLRLAEPLHCPIPKAGVVEFTRIVLSLDEPEAFLGALEEAGLPVQTEGADGGRRPPAGEERKRDIPEPPVPSTAGRPVALELEGLVKRYGDRTAVRGISLHLYHGEILAFLGSNGAGKTTTLKIIAGLLAPTAGRVRAWGLDVWGGDPEARRLLGYVPDTPLLHEWLTAREFLWFVAGLYGLPREAARRESQGVLQRLGMEPYADQPIRTFSLGMRRKTALAGALIHRPKVLLLDEVTNGLDPRAAREVKDLVAQLAREGVAVLLATHHLDVAEELAHRIAVIDAGALRAAGSMDELRGSLGLPDAGLEEIFLTLTSSGRRSGTGDRAEEVASR